MLFHLFSFLFSIIGLGIATYTDLRQRIISNKVNYSLIALGIGLHAIRAFVEADAMVLATAAAVTAATFAGAYALWKLGVWAGGDVKLMTGIAALNPFNPNFLWNVLGIKVDLLAPVGLPVFPLTLFIFSLFAMLPYGILIGARGLMKRKDLQQELKADARKKFLQTVSLSAAVVGIGALLLYFGITPWLVLPLLVVLGLLPGKIRLAAVAATFIFALYYDAWNAAAEFAGLFVFFLAAYICIKLFIVSRKVLREGKRISELREGDIPAESIYLRGETAARVAGVEMKRIINYLKDNKLKELQEYLFPRGKEIVSSRKARGVTPEEINALQELVKEGKLQNSIELKLSAPFVPAILIAYLALNVCGDLLWNLVL